MLAVRRETWNLVFGNRRESVTVLHFAADQRLAAEQHADAKRLSDCDRQRIGQRDNFEVVGAPGPVRAFANLIDQSESSASGTSRLVALR